MSTKVTKAMLESRLKDSMEKCRLLGNETAEKESRKRIDDSTIRGLEADVKRLECKTQTAGLAMRTIQQVLTAELHIQHGQSLKPLQVLCDDGVSWKDKEDSLDPRERRAVRLLRHINTLTEAGL